MAFQDEASRLLEQLSAQVAGAPDEEVAPTQRVIDDLLAAEGAREGEIRSAMHNAGRDLADRGRDLLVELGYPELVDDRNAVMFVAMTALSSIAAVIPIAGGPN